MNPYESGAVVDMNSGHKTPAAIGAPSVDALAQEIRRVDGAHAMGAAALAEALMPFVAALAAAASQPAPAVAGPVEFSAAHVSYIDRYGGHCRDCADGGGVCLNRGLPCADSKKAILFVLDALAYGINNSYIAAPTALAAPQPAPAVAGLGSVVAYLDVGAGGYLDLGTELSEKVLAQLPKGRHMLAIAGTYGADGYSPAPAAQAAPQPPAAQGNAERRDMDARHAAIYRWLIRDITVAAAIIEAWLDDDKASNDELHDMLAARAARTAQEDAHGLPP